VDIFYVNPTIQINTSTVTVPAPGPGLGCSQTTPAERQQFSFSVIGLGIDLLRLRFPLAVSLQYPLGQFRPYLAAGPAILFVEGKQTSNLTGQTKSLRTPEFGLKAGAGFDVVIEKNVSLFTEYRYVYFQTTGSFPGGGNQDTLSTIFHLHTFLFGISFHLDPGYRYPWVSPR
jgi:opacity protein-like surface antigen